MIEVDSRELNNADCHEAMDWIHSNQGIFFAYADPEIKMVTLRAKFQEASKAILFKLTYG